MNGIVKKDQHGLTLVEVLLTLVIFSMISSLIYGVFIQFNKHYTKINTEVYFRDESDIILTTFLNYIYPSNDVSHVPGEENLLKIGVANGKFVNLGFKDENAVVSNQYSDLTELIFYEPINREDFEVYIDPLDSGHSSKLEIRGSNVFVRLHLRSPNSAAKDFVVETNISFVK